MLADNRRRLSVGRVQEPTGIALVAFAHEKLAAHLLRRLAWQGSCEKATVIVSDVCRDSEKSGT